MEGVEALPFSPALRQAPSGLNVAEALTTYRRFVERNLRGEGGAEDEPEDPTLSRSVSQALNKFATCQNRFGLSPRP